METPQSDRHLFHHRYSRQLTRGVALALTLIIVLLFRLPAITIVWGTVLGCGVLLYFFLLHMLPVRWFFQKELMISTIYAAGLFIGPLSLYPGSFTALHLLLFLNFGCMALLNLLIFSLYDHDFDRVNGFSSTILFIGERKSNRLIQLLFMISLAFVLLIMYLEPLTLIFWVILAAMWSVLLCIYTLRKYAVLLRYFRWIGDGIFIFPLVYLV